MRPLRLGTRGSDLALTQSGHVADALNAIGADVALHVIRTRGDVLTDVALQKNVDKGFFTTEIEAALRAGEIDLAVHSLKDLPTAGSYGLVIGATPLRAPSTDVLLVRRDAVGEGPLPLRAGARVGTSAARRVALLAAAAPEAVALPLRGNVPTRLAAPTNGKADAVILARAGLTRLALPAADLAVYDLLPQRFVPAPGQGALAVQCRVADTEVRMLLAGIHDAGTADAVGLERGVLARLEGGCHAAVGAWVDHEAGLLRAGALIGGKWRAVAVPLGAEADALAFEVLMYGRSEDEPGPWYREATPWWT